MQNIFYTFQSLPNSYQRLITNTLTLQGLELIHFAESKATTPYMLSAEARRESRALIYDRHA